MKKKIDDLLKDSKVSYHRLTVSLDRETYETVQSKSDKLGVSKSSIVNVILRKFFAE